MKPLCIPFVMAMLAVGCATTEIFELAGSESFNSDSLQGNWNCGVNIPDEEFKGGVLKSDLQYQSWREIDGHLNILGVITLTFEKTGVTKPFEARVLFYGEGEWKANEDEYLYKFDRFGMFATPESDRALANSATSPQTQKAMKKPETALYTLEDGVMVLQSDTPDNQIICWDWKLLMENCSQEAGNCGKRIDDAYREKLRSRYLKD